MVTAKFLLKYSCKYPVSFYGWADISDLGYEIYDISITTIMSPWDLYGVTVCYQTSRVILNTRILFTKISHASVPHSPIVIQGSWKIMENKSIFQYFKAQKKRSNLDGVVGRKQRKIMWNITKVLLSVHDHERNTKRIPWGFISVSGLVSVTVWKNLYKGSIIRRHPPHPSQVLILFAENVTIYITNTETEISHSVIYLIYLEVAWDTRKGGEMQMLSISQRS